MKIVHALGWYFPDSLGGTEVYVAALSKRLQELGHHVSIAAPDPNADGERTYEHDGIEVYRYPIPREPTRAEAQGRTIVRGAPMFHRFLESARPDVFHCHSLVTGLGIHELKVARSLGARVIATCHTPSLGFLCQRGTMMQWGRQVCDGIAQPAKCAACSLQARGMPEPLARWFGSVPPALSALGGRVPGKLGTAVGMVDLIRRNQELQRELLDTVDAFVLLTRWAYTAVAANAGSERKLVLNRLGIVTDGFDKQTPRQTPSPPVRFGFVGRFHVTKGVFVLAEAIARLPRDLVFSLELRGPVNTAEDRSVLASVERILAGDRRVRFASAVKHEEVAPILSGYDVLLCPSIWLEGGPTIAMEAQATGTPVVGSRIGGLAEIIEDDVNGRLLPPGDSTVLSSVIEEIVDRPSMVGLWRQRLPATRFMDDVALDYVALYRPGCM
jgi:glycosyltransferase involved in cell wall biosynthesis